MLNNSTPYIYPCLYQKSLSLTISISKLAYASGFYWPRALAFCSGSVLRLSLWLGFHLDATWGRYAVVE